MRKLIFFLLISLPAYGQTNTKTDAPSKLRVLSAPGMTNSTPDSWQNTLSAEDQKIDLVCNSCTPTKNISVPVADVDSVSYGEAAYHHWKAGLATSLATLGGGAIVGFWPHHRHYFTINLKDKTAISLQADKHDYRQIAQMLNTATGLPIEVTQNDVKNMKGVPVKVTIQ